MFARTSSPRAVTLAGAGSVIALLSLWLPWYTIKLPELFRGAFDKLGSGGASGTGSGATTGGAAEAFAGLFKGIAAALPSEITGKGWQVMNGGDVALAVAAGAALLLVAAVAGGFGPAVRIDRGLAGRLVAVAGLVVAGIALFHVFDKPGSGAGDFSTIATVKMGIWVAAAAGAMMAAGGLLLGRPARRLDHVAVPGAGAAFLPPSDVPEGAADQAPPAVDPFAAPDLETAADPFAAPEPPPAAVESFAAAAPMTAAAADPFASPERAPAPASDPFASPDPLPAPSAVDPFASPDPLPEPDTAYGTSEQKQDLAPEPYIASDPYAAPEPEPYVAPDAYAAPEPEPYVAPEDIPADPSPVPVAAPSEPRPEGVSIPPPGWTPAT